MRLAARQQSDGSVEVWVGGVLDRTIPDGPAARLEAMDVARAQAAHRKVALLMDAQMGGRSWVFRVHPNGHVDVVDPGSDGLGSGPASDAVVADPAEPPEVAPSEALVEEAGVSSVPEVPAVTEESAAAEESAPEPLGEPDGLDDRSVAAVSVVAAAPVAVTAPVGQVVLSGRSGGEVASPSFAQVHSQRAPRTTPGVRSVRMRRAVTKGWVKVGVLAAAVLAVVVAAGISVAGLTANVEGGETSPTPMSGVNAPAEVTAEVAVSRLGLDGLSFLIRPSVMGLLADEVVDPALWSLKVGGLPVALSAEGPLLSGSVGGLLPGEVSWSLTGPEGFEISRTWSVG